jgi:hypothetical protein
LQHYETVEEHGDAENTQSDPTVNNNSDEEQVVTLKMINITCLQGQGNHLNTSEIM